MTGLVGLSSGFGTGSGVARQNSEANVDGGGGSGAAAAAAAGGRLRPGPPEQGSKVYELPLTVNVPQTPTPAFPLIVCETARPTGGRGREGDVSGREGRDGRDGPPPVLPVHVVT